MFEYNSTTALRDIGKQTI